MREKEHAQLQEGTMKKLIVCCLLFGIPIAAMKTSRDQLFQDDRFCAILDSKKNVLAVLSAKAALACQTIQASIQFDEPSHDLSIPRTFSVHVPEQFASSKLWQSLSRYLENPDATQELATQFEMKDIYLAANFLGHQELLDRCASLWADRDYGNDHELPPELDGAVGSRILVKHGIENRIVSCLIQDAAIRKKNFKCKEVDGVWACGIADNGSVASGHANGNIYYWTKSPGGWQRNTLLVAHEGEHIGRLQYVENSTKLISSAHGKGVKIWDVQTGVCYKAFGDDCCHGFFFAYDAANHKLAISSNESHINIYDLKHLKGFGEELIFDKQPVEPSMQLEGHRSQIFALDFSPSERVLVSIAGDQRLVVWDLETGVSRAEFELLAKPFGVKFNHKGDQVVVALDNGTLQFFDMVRHQKIKDHRAHTNSVWNCYFSHDDSILFTGGEDCKIKIWALPSMECLRQISDGIGQILCMDYSESRNQLLVGFSNGTMTMVDISSVLDHLKSTKLYLKYGLNIDQARFLVKAVQATKETPLECTGETGKIFNSFTYETQQLLFKHFYLNVAIKRGSLERFLIEVSDSDSGD